MARLLSRVDLRDVAYTGVAAGLIFIGFEMVATAFLMGSATALMPLRMIGAITLGQALLDPNYSPFVAGITGLAVHLLLSVAFAVLFAEGVSRIERATEGELMATSGQRALAGTVFGTALWLVNFYVIAPLAGWTWFAGNVHHIVAFLGHAFFFGCPLGWMSSHAGGLTLVRGGDHQFDVSDADAWHDHSSTFDTARVRNPVMAIAARVETQAPVRPTEASPVRHRDSADAQRRPREVPDDDYFSTMMPWTMLVVTALPFVALFLWLIAAYLGVEYGTPPWNTHSVPPPRLY